jgi:hypothetical protein
MLFVFYYQMSSHVFKNNVKLFMTDYLRNRFSEPPTPQLFWIIDVLLYGSSDNMFSNQGIQ